MVRGEAGNVKRFASVARLHMDHKKAELLRLTLHCPSSCLSPQPDAKLPVSVSEWSLASNLDNPAFVNVSVPSIRAFLSAFYADQISMFVADDGVVGALRCSAPAWPGVARRRRGGKRACCAFSPPGRPQPPFFPFPISALAAGHFYWTARMGSGWDPRPSSSFPRGHQVNGTAHDQSRAAFTYSDWNFLELLRLGIAKPFDVLNVQGRCQCQGCKTGWGGEGAAPIVG